MAAQDKDPATLRGKFTAAWEDLERRVETGVQKAASRALAPLLQQVSDLRLRVEKLATKLEDVARTRLGATAGGKAPGAAEPPSPNGPTGKEKDSRS